MLRLISLTFLFLLSMSCQLLAQPSIVKKLKVSLDTLEDSIEKVDVLSALVRAYSYSGIPGESEPALVELKTCAERINSPLGMGYYYIFKSILEFNSGEIDQSYELVLKALEMAEKAGSKDFQLMADYNLAEVYAWGKLDYVKAIQILEEAIPEKITSVSRKNLGNAYRSLGNFYEYRGDTIKAIDYEEKALQFLQGIPEDPFIDPILGKKSMQNLDGGALNAAQVKDNLGTLYQRSGMINKALEYFNSAYQTFVEWETPFFAGLSLLNLGDCYLEFGDLVKALEAYREARSIYVDLDNQYFIAHSNVSLSWVFRRLNDLENAEESLLIARAIFLERKDSVDILYNGIHLSNLYFDLNETDKAGTNLQVSLEIAYALGDSTALGGVYTSFSQLEREKGNYAASLDYLRISEKINQRFGKVLENTNVLLRRSGVFRAWNQPDSAIHYALAAKELAIQLNQKTELKQSHLELSELYAQAGAYKQAYEQRLAYFRVYDQLNTEDARQSMKAEQVKQNIEAYEKEKTAAEANAQLLAQRNQLYILLSLTFLTLLLLSAYLLIRLRKSRQKLAVQNEELVNLNDTKDKFFGIIAHDIRSPIVALQSVDQQIRFFLKKQRFDRLEQLATMVANTTRQLDALLDNLLNWALLQRGMINYRPQSVALGETVEGVSKLYAGAMEAKSIHFDNLLPTDQSVLVDESALQTILRNLINNAIKFTPSEGEIVVSSLTKGDQVFISVKDTGTGIEPDHLKQLFALNKQSNKGTAGEKGTGLGLLLCKDLVEMNKGAIFVESELGKGSNFTFAVPLN